MDQYLRRIWRIPWLPWNVSPYHLTMCVEIFDHFKFILFWVPKCSFREKFKGKGVEIFSKKVEAHLLCLSTFQEESTFACQAFVQEQTNWIARSCTRFHNTLLRLNHCIEHNRISKNYKKNICWDFVPSTYIGAQNCWFRSRIKG